MRFPNLNQLHMPRAGWRAKAAATLGIVVLLGGALVARAEHERFRGSPSVALTVAAPETPPARVSYAPAVKKALPSIVNISSSKVVKASTRQIPQDPFFRQFFGDRDIPKDRSEQSRGSGVIVSSDGYILTNNHVIDGATDIRVTLSDKREWKARLVAGDSKTDIAVLKVDSTGLPAITVGDSSRTEVGDVVLAMGNPFGVGQTVTLGIVSATGRSGLGIEDYEDFIQTDAAINPGNSGGALVNDRGDLIGINTAIISPQGGNHGVGFAVPINLARAVMNQLVSNGKVNRAYLGILPQEVTPALAKAFQAPDHRGALISDVTPNSPAAKAGLQKGDIIVAINGKPVDDPNQFRLGISMMTPGTAVQLKLLRSGSPRDLNVTLGAFPEKEEIASRNNPGTGSALEGVAVENLDAEARRELQLPARTEGVVVTEVTPASRAAASGLKPGDVIQEVNRKPVRNGADFDSARKAAGEEVLLLVNRQGNTIYVAV